VCAESKANALAVIEWNAAGRSRCNKEESSE